MLKSIIFVTILLLSQVISAATIADCTADQYLDNETCTDCADGKTRDTANVAACIDKETEVTCPATQIKKNNACEACPDGKQPNAEKTACVDKPAANDANDAQPAEPKAKGKKAKARDMTLAQEKKLIETCNTQCMAHTKENPFDISKAIKGSAIGVKTKDAKGKEKNFYCGCKITPAKEENNKKTARKCDCTESSGFKLGLSGLTLVISYLLH